MRKLLSLVALALGASVLAPPPASAAGTCGTYNPNASYSTGTIYQPTPPYPPYTARGMAGDLVVRASTLCTGGGGQTGHFADSWVMIADDQGLGYAQAGFERLSGQVTYDFVGWWSGRATNDPFYTQRIQYGSTHRTDGTSIRYKVQYVAGNANCSPSFGNCVLMYAAGGLIASTLWDPLAEWGSGPYVPQSGAEARSLQDDIPGLLTSRTAWSDLEKQDATLTWAPHPCGRTVITPPTSRWSVSNSSCTTQTTWTNTP